MEIFEQKVEAIRHGDESLTLIEPAFAQEEFESFILQAEIQLLPPITSTSTTSITSSATTTTAATTTLIITPSLTTVTETTAITPVPTTVPITTTVTTHPTRKRKRQILSDDSEDDVMVLVENDN